MTRSADRPRGFTLIELLVVIAIIGVLAALLLRAIQSARAAARRTECLNNLPNVGAAFQNHVAHKGKLPPSARIDPIDKDQDPWTTWYKLLVPALTNYRHSWCLDLLPFLERSEIYDKWDFETKHGA